MASRIPGLISLIAWFAALALLWVCFLAASSFTKMYQDLGQPLPWLTLNILAAANFMCTPWGAAGTLFVLALSIAAYIAWPRRLATTISFFFLAGLSLFYVPLSVLALFLPLMKFVETMDK